jgi:putative ABC transport system permease protein
MNNLRFALRQLRARPTFTLMAALSLALGIGLVSTQFSLIDGILLRGLPVPGSERLMHISYVPPNAESEEYWDSIPYRDYLRIREGQTVFESVAAITVGGVNLSGKGRIPSHQAGGFASANLLDTLGVGPALGRWFTAAEDVPGQPLLAVLSHALWVEEFGADPAVLGKPLTVNGEAGTIIGVMPPKFSFPGNQRIWLNMRPIGSDPRVRRIERAELFGKLRPGVTREQATAELSAIAASLQSVWPETNQGYNRMKAQPVPFAYSTGGTRPILYLMFAMTGFILALACVNVANMLLGRAAQRTRELAVRAAVGASAGRIVRQLLGESLLLALLGAIGGLIVARFGVDWLQSYFVNEMNAPGWFEFRLDGRVATIAVACTVLAGVLAGLLPAWQASRLDVNTALKDDSRAASNIGVGRIGKWLVTAQIAFSSALLVAACVLGWTVYSTRDANIQFHPEQLLAGRIELQEGTQPTPEARAIFYRKLLTRLAEEPGVEAVAVSSRDFVGSGVYTAVAPEGMVFKHDNERPNVWLEVVSEGYFNLIGVRPRQGRLFDSRDYNVAQRSAVVNESFARRFWPGEDPVGRRFKSSQTDDHWVTVVGVVPDLKMQGVFQPEGRNEEGFYLVQDQMGWGWLDLFVRVKGDPAKIITPLRQAIASLDPDQPIHSVATLEVRTQRAMRGFTMIGTMAGLFAAVTLFLGAIGVYGVTSLAVSRRVHEFGIRMALGASVRQVLGLVLAQGGRQIGLGLLAGLATGFAITRPMQNIFGPQMANNPFIYVVVAAIIACVGLVALWLPARRASRIDPMQALRSE